jgi:hypothetical protein
MRQVYQVIDGSDIFMQVLLTVTSPAGKAYTVLSRIRVQPHEVSKCQCRLSKTGCGRADYIAEFYVIVDHHTKIIPVIVAYVMNKVSATDGTKLYLSADAKIVTASVEDDSVDSPVHPPLE